MACMRCTHRPLQACADEWSRNDPIGAERQRRRRGKEFGARRIPYARRLCEHLPYNQVQEATGATKRATHDLNVAERRGCWPRPERARKCSNDARRLIRRGGNGHAASAPSDVDSDPCSHETGAQ